MFEIVNIGLISFIKNLKLKKIVIIKKTIKLFQFAYIHKVIIKRYSSKANITIMLIKKIELGLNFSAKVIQV